MCTNTLTLIIPVKYQNTKDCVDITSDSSMNGKSAQAYVGYCISLSVHWLYRILHFLNLFLCIQNIVYILYTINYSYWLFFPPKNRPIFIVANFFSGLGLLMPTDNLSLLMIFSLSLLSVLSGRPTQHVPVITMHLRYVPHQDHDVGWDLQ